MATATAWPTSQNHNSLVFSSLYGISNLTLPTTVIMVIHSLSARINLNLAELHYNNFFFNLIR